MQFPGIQLQKIEFSVNSPLQKKRWWTFLTKTFLNPVHKSSGHSLFGCLENETILVLNLAAK